MDSLVVSKKLMTGGKETKHKTYTTIPQQDDNETTKQIKKEDTRHQNNMTAKDEAKQLDSVTDRVQENETLDSSKAKSAMAALTSSSSDAIAEQKKLAKIKISKEDVDLIVDELEITEDVASKTLREVIAQGIEEGKTPLGEALRKLITT